MNNKKIFRFLELYQKSLEKQFRIIGAAAVGMSFGYYGRVLLGYTIEPVDTPLIASLAPFILFFAFGGPLFDYWMNQDSL
ncbi:MAG TPA: hypothetical protein VHO47_02070 [Candidatus Babeliales bacterium]|nr:hypothetical protein [Candidatus Babeliales bacterium]